MPWRVVSLIRQYTKSFAVLVPHRAFSAATLIALGADEIVMHKMGCLGPIDPSVANIFNPPHPSAPGQQAPISVEDVTAFFRFVKEEVGITHEDELLIDNLKSNLFFHGHPINRKEAKTDLKLKVVEPPETVESLMWELYLQYENDLKLNEPFNASREVELKVPVPTARAPVTTAQIVQQMGSMAQAGVAVGVPGLTEETIVKLAVAMIPFLQGGGSVPASGKVALQPILGAFVESIKRADVFKTDLRLERATINTPAGPQEAVKQEVLWQRWEEEK